MIVINSIKIPLLLSFGLGVCFSDGQSLNSLHTLNTNENAKEIMHDNEFVRTEIGQTENIYCNPLLLDGRPLDYGSFTLRTRGELALVKGEPGTPGSTKILFFIRLIRDGRVVDGRNMLFLNKGLHEIEISNVLAFAQPGDQLIIDPVRKEDWKAKRILNLVL